MLYAFEARAPSLLAKFGFHLADAQFDLRDAEVMRERAMNFGGERTNRFLALADLSNRDGIAAGGRGSNLLDDSERNDIGGESRVPYVPQRLMNRLDWNIARHVKNLTTDCADKHRLSEAILYLCNP